MDTVAWDRRVRQAFGAVLTDRGAVRARLGGQLPAFLAEFLIGAYGLQRASELVAAHWPSARRLQALKYQLLKDGTLDVLDYLEASVDLADGAAKGRLAAFQETVAIVPAVLDQWPDLLSGGMWGRVSLSRTVERAAPAWLHEDGAEDETPFPEDAGGMITDLTAVGFEPYQVSVDVEAFARARSGFSTEEWIDLLLASSGYNPVWIRSHPHGRRLTRLYLLRLLPLVERNLNVMELGPKNTGKTHLLRNLSPYAYTVAGGQATPANLFVNLATQAAGLIQSRRVILFDEVARLDFSRNHATLSLLKDYMESGQFSRGRSSYGADTSLVFMGNLDVQGNRPAARYRHLFQVLPSHLQDTAVLDRLHSFIPGWELPKLTPDALNVGLALASDYFGEVLLALRDWSYEGHWRDVLRRWPFRPGLTQRDVVALDRLGRAFFKLVFPDGVIDEDVAIELLSVISEGRQRIHDQLVKMEPGEFTFRPIGFEGVSVVSDDAGAVETERDRVMNRSPHPGQSTGAAGSLDPVSGGINADVVVIQAVIAKEASSRRPLILADEGLEGVDSAWHTVRFYLEAHRHSLGLDSRVRWEGLGVQLSGGPGDVRGRAELALVLAVVSAWLAHPLKPALAAIGGLTLSGEVTVPPEILTLVMAVLSRGRDIIMLPAQSPMSLIEDTFSPHFPRLTLVPIETVEDALRYSFRP